MGAAIGKLVVLDRDGVINYDSDEYVKSPSEWRAIPGSLEATARLHEAGYRIVVATNQSGIGRGLFSEETLEDINAVMRREVEAAGGALDGVYYCPHRPDQDCDCRKPEPGLLKQIERDFGESLRGVPVIGDKLSDLQAAEAVGARAILVRTGKGQHTYVALAGRAAEVYADLASAVDALLAEQQGD